MTATIWVMRPGALGDCLLTLPALHALRRKFPAHRLVLVARADVLPLMHGVVADEVVDFDAPQMASLFARAHGSPNAQVAGAELVVAWLPAATAQTVSENLRQLAVQRLLLAPPPLLGATLSRHAADYLMDSLAPLGIGPQPLPAPVLPLSDAVRARADDFWRIHQLATARVVALHVGSGGAQKCWPLAHFLTLAQRLAQQAHTRVILIAGPAEAERMATDDLANRLKSMNTDSTSQSRPMITLVSPPLTQLAATLARCALYIGNDSGVTHLAAAIGTPTVALFGPTDPAVWAPRGAHVTIVRSLSGRMEDMSVEQVWEAVTDKIAG